MKLLASKIFEGLLPRYGCKIRFCAMRFEPGVDCLSDHCSCDV